MNGNIKAVYIDRDVIIIEKPAGMPSQPDPSGDTDAMSAASELLRERGEEPSLWLVHMLDRVVGGLIAFARNKSSAAALSALAAGDGIEKIYLAFCHGECEDGERCDFLYKDSATKKSYVVKTERRGAKRASLTVKRVAQADGTSLVRVKLHTGRFHQIRAQLSHAGWPLLGDGKYGSERQNKVYGESKGQALHSWRLKFTFETPSGILEYLNGKSFEAPRPEFVEKYFKAVDLH